MKRKKLDIIDPFRDQLFQNKDSITRKLEKLVPFLYSNTDCKLKKKKNTVHAILWKNPA